jgi:hypothetical protein
MGKLQILSMFRLCNAVYALPFESYIEKMHPFIFLVMFILDSDILFFCKKVIIRMCLDSVYSCLGSKHHG